MMNQRKHTVTSVVSGPVLVLGLLLLAVPTWLATGCDDDDNVTDQGGLPLPDVPWFVDTAEYPGGSLAVVDGFVKPYGFSFDHESNLYVPDLEEGRVVRFTPELAFNGWLGAQKGGSVSGWHMTGQPVKGTGNGQLYMPHSVAFDQAGDIVVADYMSGSLPGRVHRYAPDGAYLGLFFPTPDDVTLTFDAVANARYDDQFNLWVADFDGNRIYKFAPDGSFVGWLGEHAGGGITNGFVTAGRAQQSSALGGFFKPHVVQVIDSGYFLVAETGNHRIQKFNPDGQFVGWLGARDNGSLTDGWATTGVSGPSSTPGGFINPVSVRLTPDNELLVADNGNNRIQKFDLDGHFTGWMGGLAGGGVTSGWQTTGQSVASNLPGAFEAPFDTWMRDSKLYVADGHNGRIQIFELTE